MSFDKGKMKKLILIICLIGFSTAYALQFQSFNFNDESGCAEQLGQLPVSLPRDIINPNYLSKSKEICLKAYIGDNACRKEYRRQKDALGLTSGVSSNYTAEQQAQAKAQCGTWLKSRRSACESFLQKVSAVCYQLSSQAEQRQQKEAEALADNLLGTWKGSFGSYGGSGGNAVEGSYQITLHINHQISSTEFSGVAYINSPIGNTAKESMDINIANSIAYMNGTVLSTTNKNGWQADNFELSIGDGVMRGTSGDSDGSSGNTVLRKQ